MFMLRQHLLTVGFLFVVAGVSWSAQVYVDATGSDGWDGTSASFEGGAVGPKQTIQAAIDIAANGDTVIVADGVYAGVGNRDLDFNGLAITLRSGNGPDACTIDCGGSAGDLHRAVSFDSGETTTSVLRGFTITGSYAVGAVYCSGSSPTIDDCVFIDNYSESRGSALAGENASPTLTDCVFTENFAAEAGAVYVFGGTLTLDGCSFYNNEAFADNPSGGGGAVLSESAALDAQACIFQGNVAQFAGGALYLIDTEAVVSSSLLAGNRARYGGAAYLETASDLTLVNVTIAENAATLRGGGLRLFQGNVCTVTNSIIWGNVARSVNGYNQIALDDGDRLAIDYTDIEDTWDTIFSEAVPPRDIAWGAHNLMQAPVFATPGSWDLNGTPDDIYDDVWTAGEYQATAAACIDTGSNAAVIDDFDVAGNDRIASMQAPEVVDLGAYELQAAPLTVSRLIVRAGRDRYPATPSDQFILQGTLPADMVLDGAEELTLRVGGFTQTITLTNNEEWTAKPERGQYMFRSRNAGVNLLKIDLNRLTFQAKAVGIDLTGLQAPVAVQIQVDDYVAFGSAADSGDSDVINGRGSLPVQLLTGALDTLSFDRAMARERDGKILSLMLRGTISAVDPEELVDSPPLTIYWGNTTYAMNGPFEQRRPNMYLFSRRPDGRDDPDQSIAKCLLDFNKGKLMLTVSRTDMNAQGTPDECTIEFGVPGSGNIVYSETAAVPQ